jgi:antitoxin CptB
LDPAGLDQFEALLTAPDQDVYAWLRGAAPVPPEHDNPVFAGLKGYCGRRDPNWKT